MRNQYRVLSEKYTSILKPDILLEQVEKTGDMTPDGESTLEIRDGNKWWNNKEGKFHNRFGPAVIQKDGTKQWWIDGLVHREDGPAVILPGNILGYYLNGKILDYEVWKKKTEHIRRVKDIYKKGSEETGLDLTNLSEKEEKAGDVSSDGESRLRVYYDNSNGNVIKHWENKDGELHNRTGPAVIIFKRKTPNILYKNWFINGKRHREDGPAVLWEDTGEAQYWLDDERYSYEDWKKEVQLRKKLKDIYKKGSEETGLNLSNL